MQVLLSFYMAFGNNKNQIRKSAFNFLRTQFLYVNKGKNFIAKNPPSHETL